MVEEDENGGEVSCDPGAFIGVGVVDTDVSEGAADASEGGGASATVVTGNVGELLSRIQPSGDGGPVVAEIVAAERIVLLVLILL